jgi:hypothetical protein
MLVYDLQRGLRVDACVVCAGLVFEHAYQSFEAAHRINCEPTERNVF